MSISKSSASKKSVPVVQKPAPKLGGMKLETPISRAMENNAADAVAALSKGKALSRVVNAPEKAPKAPKEHKPTKKEAIIKCFAEGKMTDEAIAKKVGQGVKPSYVSRIRMRANGGKLSKYMTTLITTLKIKMPMEEFVGKK